MNVKNFPGPQLRLSPALEEGEGGGGVWRGGLDGGVGGTSSFHFFCSNACLPLRGGGGEGVVGVLGPAESPPPRGPNQIALTVNFVFSCDGHFGAGRRVGGAPLIAYGHSNTAPGGGGTRSIYILAFRRARGVPPPPPTGRRTKAFRPRRRGNELPVTKIWAIHSPAAQRCQTGRTYDAQHKERGRLWGRGRAANCSPPKVQLRRNWWNGLRAEARPQKV